MIGPKCKKCRAVGEKLFLKGERCLSAKCGAVRRPYRPGVHGQSKKRHNKTEYGKQLLEKQKLKWSYGLREEQFERYFKKALSKKGVTIDHLLQMLEQRLDNVVFRLGFTPSRGVARALVRHGHFLINERRVTIPSFSVKKGDVISIRESSKTKGELKDIPARIKNHELSGWLSLDREAIRATITGLPKPEEINLPFNLNAIVEFYSR
ncbi:MAG: 30S ribosomal protein S4 [Patescibacteria group bacterium]|nr:30S ribosomal protein S4 [Patescibacteria group bacterium]MDE2437854.1 30S ribosomal protein S4 [Patescibacteria group bacterium]